MDIGKSLTFVFEDERWVSKLAIGAGVFLLGLVGTIILIGPFLANAVLMGYMIAIARNVMRGEEHPLPDWSGIGAMFVDGLKLIVAQVLWALPFLVFGVPMIFVTALLGDSSSAEGLAPVLAICVGCVGFLYTIVYMLIMPALTVRIAETGSVGNALSLSGVSQFTRDNLAHVIVVLLVIVIAQMLAGFVGSLLCGVGLLVTMPWANMVQGHLSGQLALAGGVTGPGAYVPPADPFDEPMPPVPADLPNDAAMVGEVKQQAEQVQSEWDDQAVRMDEPSEPLAWDDAPKPVDEAPEVPAQPAEPAAPATPAEPVLPDDSVPPVEPAPPSDETPPEEPPKA